MPSCAKGLAEFTITEMPSRPITCSQAVDFMSPSCVRVSASAGLTARDAMPMSTEPLARSLNASPDPWAAKWMRSVLPSLVPVTSVSSSFGDPMTTSV